MKTLIPLLSLVFGSLAVQNCTHEDVEFETYNNPSRITNEDHPASYSGRQDSTTSKVSELEPDPPVKDTHDWIIKP
jgi:hypothetical protein